MSKDRRFDISNPEVVGEMTAAQKKERDQEVSDFLEILNTPAGRRFFWRLLEKTGVFRSSFTGNSETFFREGERNIGLRLLSELNTICPEKYVQMLNEAKRKEAKDA